MCREFGTRLRGDVVAPGSARAFIRAQLTAPAVDAETGQLIDDAMLIVSELVTNAVRAGSPTLAVAGRLHHGEVEIEVTDHSSGWPARQHPNTTAAGGRGLAVIDAVSTAWCTTPRPDGKTVWAALAVPAALTTSLTCDAASRSPSRQGRDSAPEPTP